MSIEIYKKKKMNSLKRCIIAYTENKLRLSSHEKQILSGNYFSCRKSYIPEKNGVSAYSAH